MDKSTPFTHPPDDWVPNLQSEFAKQMGKKIAEEKDKVMRMRLDSFSVANIIADLVERNRELEGQLAASRKLHVAETQRANRAVARIEAVGCTWPTGDCQCMHGDGM